MVRIALLWLMIAGCAHGPGRNEVVAPAGRTVSWRAPIATATFCAHCGRAAPVTIVFGTPARLSLVIPTCYAHATSKVGDHDNVQISLVEGHVAAVEGELEIADCTSKHVTAKLWAQFPDKTRIEAAIDTELVEPGK